MDGPRRELLELSSALRFELERERRRGRRHVVLSESGLAALDAAPAPTPSGKDRLPVNEPEPTPRRTAARPKPAPGAAAAGTPDRGDGKRGKKLARIPVEPEPADYADRMQELEALRVEASTCVKCGLCKTRNQVVFGSGRARTRVMFIGEAPGGDEDRQGLPFVGRAGKLLDQIIDAVGFDREEVYVANILKCRPPRNRDPLPEEIESCTPYLERQIELVKPRIICALGRFAGQFLTGQPKVPIGKIRGRIASYKDSIMVLPIYHPAALLRNPNLKRIVWEDVQLLRKEYLR